MIAGVLAAADRPALAGTFGAAAGAASSRDCGGVKTSWLRAVGLAAFMLLASYLLFVLVPNNLLSYLSLHASPRNRDLLVSAWWVLAFGFGCWLFVRLQQTKAR